MIRVLTRSHFHGIASLCTVTDTVGDCRCGLRCARESFAAGFLHGGVTDPRGAFGAASPASFHAGNAHGVRTLRSVAPARRSSRRFRRKHPTCRFPDARLDAFSSRDRPPEF